MSVSMPTFVQVRVAFGLVIEALAASVPSSTNRASWSDVTASSGHPRCGAGKSNEEGKKIGRERDWEKRNRRKERGHKQLKIFSLSMAQN